MKRPQGIHYVYEHWRPDKDVPFYVGQGKGKRANDMNGRNRHHRSIQAKLKRLGMCVEVRMVAESLADWQSKWVEIERIAFWRSQGVSLSNRTEGGEGRLGCSPSPMTLLKISKGLREAWNDPVRREAMMAPRFGLKRTPETGQKISAALRGKPKTEEHRRHCSEWQTGRTLSDSHKENLGKPVVCLNDGLIYPTMTIAAKQYGLSKDMVSRVCSGRAKTTRGYSFDLIRPKQ